MITESYYWKKPLLDTAEKISKTTIAAESKDFDEIYNTLEREISIGFYSIRKLLDTKATITDELRSSLFEIEVFKNTKIKEIRERDRFHFHEFYNLEESHKEKRKLKYICDSIIHSFVFCIGMYVSGEIICLYFTSDTNKEDKLYCIDIKEICRIFNAVGNNYPKHISIEYEEDGAEKIEVL